MSLKKLLHTQLQIKGELTINEVEQICRENNFKISNAERRLRTSESPWVAKITNDRGAIIAYRWLEPKKELFPQRPIQQAIIVPRIRD